MYRWDRRAAVGEGPRGGLLMYGLGEFGHSDWV